MVGRSVPDRRNAASIESRRSGTDRPTSKSGFAIGYWPFPALQSKATPMYQIVFNEISASELAKIPKEVQLELLAEFQFLPDDLDHLDSKVFGLIEREGRKLYRYRANDYRIYFQRSPEGIVVHRVLHKNTIRDFLFRSKLPMAEDEQLEKSSGFWKLIEEGERTKRN
jgi:mRNA-degrading endonuclease RelE of RelBE toxin-antitoxin system